MHCFVDPVLYCGCSINVDLWWKILLLPLMVLFTSIKWREWMLFLSLLAGQAATNSVIINGEHVWPVLMFSAVVWRKIWHDFINVSFRCVIIASTWHQLFTAKSPNPRIRDLVSTHSCFILFHKRIVLITVDQGRVNFPATCNELVVCAISAVVWITIIEAGCTQRSITSP